MAETDDKMIEIIAAIYPEAEGLIHGLALHKQASASPFAVYTSEEECTTREGCGISAGLCKTGRKADIRLTITGTGRVAAAAAVGNILGRYTREELQEVQLVNFGSCARIGEETGNREKLSDDTGGRKLYIIHKIVEEGTGRTYYPDVLLRNSLPEATLVTGDRIWDGKGIPAAEGAGESAETADYGFPEAAGSGPVLYDMEAAGIYAAGRLFLGPHQMHFLKGITDTGVNSHMDPGEFSSRMNTYAGDAVEYIRQVAASGQKLRQPRTEDQTVQRISTAVHASATMQMQIRQLVHYAVLTQRDPDRIFADCCENFCRKNPARRSADICHDRREGKILLEMFRNCVAS